MLDDGDVPYGAFTIDKDITIQPFNSSTDVREVITPVENITIISDSVNQVVLNSLKVKGNDYKEQVARIDFDSLKPYYINDFAKATFLAEAKQQFITLKDGVYELSVPFYIESFDYFKNIDKQFAVNILKSIVSSRKAK